METLKHLINVLSSPKVLLSLLLAAFFFFFPVNASFERWNRKLGIYRIWTWKWLGATLALLSLFLGMGLTDLNFRRIVLKPDNVPIVGLLYLVVFFLWTAMIQASENDRRLERGEKPAEASGPKEKVLVVPDLVYIELIAMVLCTLLLFAWSIVLKAPLEDPANPSLSPNPSKAPWYFLGLQELLVYFDPWIAGVVIPGVIILGLMAIPYIDTATQGSGYYSFKGRKKAVSLYLFGWLILWIFLIYVGTFLRGPNWNFFGPFEPWDIHKVETLNNVNLSEYIYPVWFGVELPKNILLREAWGILFILSYFFALPPLLAKTAFRKISQRLGPVRYGFLIAFLLLALLLPIKMYLRWIFNLKYIVAIPEYFFNI